MLRMFRRFPLSKGAAAVAAAAAKIFLSISENAKLIERNTDGSWSKFDLGLSIGTIKGLVRKDGLYFAIHNAHGHILKSTDSHTWSVAANITAAAGTVLLTNENLLVVAIGSSYFYTSVDGTTWTARATWNTVTSKSGCYGGGKFVIVGPNQIGVSPDGINWTRYTAVTGALNDVAYGDGQYALVCNGGQIWTSPDAVTWTQRTSNFTAGFSSTNLYGIAYGNGVWVAGGDGGRRYSSTDGINWTLRSAPTSQAILSIAFTDGYFWAAGNSGSLTRSADGINWELINVGAGTTDITEISVV